nr:hypothetical protein GCM10020093_083840 [Planobispora longispora]
MYARRGPPRTPGPPAPGFPDAVRLLRERSARLETLALWSGSNREGYAVHHNGLRTAFLLGVLSAVIIAVGAWLGGGAGVQIAVLIALLANGAAYFFSDRIALSAMRARPVGEVEQPVLYRIVRELSTEARQPMPRLYVSPTMQPNAFATGRNPVTPRSA